MDRFTEPASDRRWIDNDLWWQDGQLMFLSSAGEEIEVRPRDGCADDEVIIDEMPLYDVQPGRKPRRIDGALFWGRARIDARGDVVSITLRATGDDYDLDRSSPLFPALAASLRVHAPDEVFNAAVLAGGRR